jgi:hypothetical protein
MGAHPSPYPPEQMSSAFGPPDIAEHSALADVNHQIRWESLIEFDENDPLFDRMLDATPVATASLPGCRVQLCWLVVAAKLNQLWVRFRWSAAVALLLAIALASAAGVLKLRTHKTVILPDNASQNAAVGIEGDRVMVTGRAAVADPRVDSPRSSP